jgi:hypothetical protein
MNRAGTAPRFFFRIRSKKISRQKFSFFSRAEGRVEKWKKQKNGEAH